MTTFDFVSVPTYQLIPSDNASPCTDGTPRQVGFGVNEHRSEVSFYLFCWITRDSSRNYQRTRKFFLFPSRIRFSFSFLSFFVWINTRMSERNDAVSSLDSCYVETRLGYVLFVRLERCTGWKEKFVRSLI